MAWETVAQGSLTDLQSLVGDMELPKGTRVKVEFDLSLPVGWAFDLPGAELAFRGMAPEGMGVVDVWGEGKKGYVEMEAAPAWLVAVLAFISANWLSIIIAGAVLSTLVYMARVSIQTPTPTGVFGALAPLALVGLVAFLALGRFGQRKGREG